MSINFIPRSVGIILFFLRSIYPLSNSTSIIAARVAPVPSPTLSMPSIFLKSLRLAFSIAVNSVSSVNLCFGFVSILFTLDLICCQLSFSLYSNNLIFLSCFSASMEFVLSSKSRAVHPDSIVRLAFYRCTYMFIQHCWRHGYDKPQHNHFKNISFCLVK